MCLWEGMPQPIEEWLHSLSFHDLSCIVHGEPCPTPPQQVMDSCVMMVDDKGLIKSIREVRQRAYELLKEKTSGSTSSY